jgi:alkylated DNA repair dioxygenase AlkB
VFESLAWQASLFGDGPVAGDPAFATLRRTQLDDDSWIDYAPGWLTGSDELFSLLLAQGDWRQRQRWMYEKTVAEPRLTAGFSAAQPPGIGARRVSDLRAVPTERVDDLVPGGDAGTRRDAAGTPPELTAVCDLLSERYGVDFDSIWVNLYRDGADSVAWHGDRNGRTQHNPFVVTISLGGRRLFQLRPKGTTTVTHRFNPGQGDLLVMGGACQHEWEHCVPKTKKPVQPRMSVTIRHSKDTAGQVEIPPESEW